MDYRIKGKQMVEGEAKLICSRLPYSIPIQIGTITEMSGSIWTNCSQLTEVAYNHLLSFLADNVTVQIIAERFEANHLLSYYKHIGKELYFIRDETIERYITGGIVPLRMEQFEKIAELSEKYISDVVKNLN